MWNKESLILAGCKACIVLIPSYTAAYLTEKMVWVVPTLAAASFFAGSIQLDQSKVRRRLDDDHEDADVIQKELELKETVETEADS